MRFGLVGTGYWARVTHAPALASTAGVDLAAVWGRDTAAAAKLAAEHGATPHADLDAFLDDVEAVAFAVPPDVQAPIAVRAANRGKHLLLEKPIAVDQAAADALTEAVEHGNVASVVFFTSRFQPEIRDWLGTVAATPGWLGGLGLWLGTALSATSPFNTPWRRDKGALWDTTPHLVSLLWATLGPVTGVTAVAGPADVTHLVLRHENGATSTATTTLSAPREAAIAELTLWGEAGRSAAPLAATQPVPALRTALAELTAAATSGQLRHPCDVRFGHAIGRVLAAAADQLS
ncbi:MAG TPA: Gfo/Idh/MocA family oxidoreductase [Streptosporangiaceae bacterium]|nr:Gfo/Idh/MocA family oxidoreductase [Streptosporangiaceae bacterium]